MNRLNFIGHCHNAGVQKFYGHTTDRQPTIALSQINKKPVSLLAGFAISDEIEVNLGHQHFKLLFLSYKPDLITKGCECKI